ncbi:FeoA domain-containing protein, partial [Candidatus Aerophobetes bacterium]|nr:FeoA domain-containing protein [Candidatus Aerophobetes bacterium]
GRKVRKIAAQPIGGPIMVEIVGGGRVAIGRGMAAKILLKR